MFDSFLGNLGKKYFVSTTFPDLNDLEIPSVIWNMSTCDKPCLKNERQVLLDMYRLLDGKKWKKKWDVESKNVLQNHSFHCNWHGILCDNTTNHVLAIHLPNNNLHGELTTKFNILQFLVSLHIGSNSIRGKFDKIVAAMPRHLLRLDLAFSEIYGKIPKNIAERIPLLSKLQSSATYLVGEIPESIGDLIHLGVLSIGETQLKGSIPHTISRLTNLWFLDFQGLDIKGDLSSFCNLRELRYLHLSSNEFTGTIPEDIGLSWPNLTELLLQNTKLSGHLPRSIGMLKKLKALNVAKNRLSGLIPRDIFNLTLEILILSSNNFTGFEPSNKSTFNHLNIFIASYLPAFSCSLQTALSYLNGSRKTIMQIDLSHSNIHGNLPSFVYSFVNLAFLKLASNKLNGEIPSPWSFLPHCTVIHLQNNNLSGRIPMAFSRIVMLRELNVKGNKLLNGHIAKPFLTLDYEMRIKERLSDTCPLVRFAHNHGALYVDSSYYSRTYCYCDEHFFGNGKDCRKCMPGGYCPGVRRRSSTSKPDELLTRNSVPESKMLLMQGYFPFPNESDVKSIHKCPSSGHYYKICVPSKYCGCLVTEGKVHCNKSCLCYLGHHGRYCSLCIDGYYKEGIRCYQCPEGSSKGFKFGALFGATVGMILLSVGILFISTKRLRLSVLFAVIEILVIFGLVLKHLISVVVLQVVVILFIFGFSSHLQRCTALLKTAVFYLQVMDSLVSTTDIWPKSMHSIQVYITSSFNLSFSSLACTFPIFFTLFAKSLTLFSLPFACIGLLWLAYFLCKLCTKRTKQKRLALNYKCRKYSLVIIDLAYFPLVKSCFSIIAGCIDIGGVSFMKRYAWIDCNSSEHNSLTVIAVLQMMLYVIAVPFLIYLPLLLHHRSQLSDDCAPICYWLSPLIAPYKPKYRAYIEVVMLLRRLLIAILMTSFPASSPLQTQCITIVLLVAIIFQAVKKPYKNPNVLSSRDEWCNKELGVENAIEIFMLSCLLLSFVCVGLSASHGTLVPSGLFSIAVIINIIFVAAFCYCILYRILQPASSKEESGSSSESHEPLIEVVEDSYSRDSS